MGENAIISRPFLCAKSSQRGLEREKMYQNEEHTHFAHLNPLFGNRFSFCLYRFLCNVYVWSIVDQNGPMMIYNAVVLVLVY